MSQPMRNYVRAKATFLGLLLDTGRIQYDDRHELETAFMDFEIAAAELRYARANAEVAQW